MNRYRMIYGRHDLAARLHETSWQVAGQERGGFGAFIFSMSLPGLGGDANSSQYHQMENIDLTIVIIIHQKFSFPEKKITEKSGCHGF
ncbi:hypothetical protein [Paraburkholderia sp. GAS42]|uniref:hypothetical protein n=1 Tax=Paraburkholderia sp. GAS42 TaxID=3035135 RepID=UPI003D246EB2